MYYTKYISLPHIVYNYSLKLSRAKAKIILKSANSDYATFNKYSYSS